MTSAIRDLPAEHIDSAIRPFRIEVPQSELDDLDDRLARVRWPAAGRTGGWSDGVPVSYLQGLVTYWRTRYDWRKQEARLNESGQFTAEVRGRTIHFLHVRSPESNAMPLIFTPGRLGSVADFLNLIGPLTDPRCDGRDPADAFDLVIPSLPGLGLGGLDRGAPWEVTRIARAWAELMGRLGYPRYGAAGGDLGALVALELCRADPEHVTGAHAHALGRGFARGGLPQRESGFRHGTLAYGLTDSPVAQLAWMIEAVREWTDASTELPEETVDRDCLLTNATLCWLTRTAGNVTRVYAEPARLARIASEGTPQPPIGVAVFPQDGVQREAISRQHKVVQWSRFERGGYFAALEAPDLLVRDIRKFFRRLR